MGKVRIDISMSLDGFIAGPNDSVEKPMGDEGEQLHNWIFSGKDDKLGDAPLTSAEESSNADVLTEMNKATGAVIMGRQSFDVGEKMWGEHPPFHVPCFILTHHVQEKMVKAGGTSYTFVNNDIEDVLAQATKVANGKDVSLMGANIAQQFIKAGLLDEIQIHLVPILLGKGKKLFDHIGKKQVRLERTLVITSSDVTHLRFRVLK